MLAHLLAGNVLQAGTEQIPQRLPPRRNIRPADERRRIREAAVLVARRGEILLVLIPHLDGCFADSDECRGGTKRRTEVARSEH